MRGLLRSLWDFTESLVGLDWDLQGGVGLEHEDDDEYDEDGGSSSDSDSFYDAETGEASGEDETLLYDQRRRDVLMLFLGEGEDVT
jgi:hypothetical protein